MNDAMRNVYRQYFASYCKASRDSLYYGVPDGMRDHPYIKEHMDSCFRLLDYWNALIEDGQESVVENLMRCVLAEGREVNRVAWSMVVKEIDTEKEPFIAMARMCGYATAISAMTDIWYKGGLLDG